MTQAKSRYDLAELAGAFGDLGPLIPFAVLNVGIAVIFGFATYHASKRGWLEV